MYALSEGLSVDQYAVEKHSSSPISLQTVGDDDDIFSTLRSHVEALGWICDHFHCFGAFLEQYAPRPNHISVIDHAAQVPSAFPWKYGGFDAAMVFRRRFGPDPILWILSDDDNPGLPAHAGRVGADGLLLVDDGPHRMAKQLTSAARP